MRKKRKKKEKPILIRQWCAPCCLAGRALGIKTPWRQGVKRLLASLFIVILVEC